MDRVTTYPNALARALDILKSNQNAMVGLAKLAEATLGSGVSVDGFACAPTAPASLSVVLGAGQVYQVGQLEASAISSLPIDSHIILKQGIQLDPTTVTLTPPTTVGYAQNILVQVAYADDDTSSQQTLNYYNAANPSVPLVGPGGNNQPQSIARKGVVSITQKAGLAAPSGSQATPTPDAGYAALYVITVAYGQTTITAGNIAPYIAAPFVPVKLPGLPAALQAGKWITVQDTGGADALVVNPSPQLAALGFGTVLRVVKAGAANATTAPTINISGLGAVPLVRRDGAALAVADLPAGAIFDIFYDGANARVLGAVPSSILAVTQPLLRTRLTANATLNVSTTGNDANATGSTSFPFLTIQAAWNYAQKTLDLNGFTLTIQCAPGNYSSGLLGQGLITGQVGPGSVIIQGNTAAPGNVAVNVTNGSAFIGQQGALFQVQGFTISASGSGILQGLGIAALNYSVIYHQLNVFAACSSYQINASICGEIWAVGSYSISAGAACHLFADGGAIAYANNVVATVLNNPTFSAAFAAAYNNGLMKLGGTYTFSGTAVGNRYQAFLNSLINTAGGGANYFPGSVAGTAGTNGGYYA
jgi:hypothetical protein